MHRVEAVARAGEVDVVAAVLGREPVVGRVVDTLEGEHRPEVVPLGRVVVDDVEDHLDPRAVERLHHALELAHLLAARPGGRVERVRREEADGRVAPVVREPARVQELLVGDVVDGEQLDGGDAERAQMVDRLLRGEAGVGAAEVLAYGRVQLREAADVGLVDHRLVPGRRERPIALPVEALVDDDALGDGRGVVRLVRLQVVAVDGVRQDAGCAERDRPLDRLGVRVDQELRRVEAVAVAGVVRPVDAVAVALARSDARHVAVPVEGRALGQLDPCLDVPLVEQAELDPLRVLREDREVRAAAVPRRSEWERPARPDGHRASGTSQTTPSGGSVTGAEYGWSCHGVSSATTAPLLTPEPP